MSAQKKQQSINMGSPMKDSANGKGGMIINIVALMLIIYS